MKLDYHVVPHPKGWAVKRESGKRAVCVCNTQKGAISAAKIRAKRHKVEVVIHRDDGTIRDSDTYGKEGKAKDRKH